MSKLKLMLKNSNNKNLQKLFLICKLLKNKDFFELIEEISKGENDVLNFKHFGDLYNNKNVYYMCFDDHVMGFFAYWKRGLVGLAFAEKYSLVPVIDWTENSPYYEKEGVDGIYNPFEYYYEPLSDVKVEDINHCQNVAFFNMFSTEKLAKSLAYGNETDEEFFAELVKKYYRVKKPLKDQLDLQINELLCEKKTLAVQIRGVEWGNVKGHPIPPSLEEYVEEIDKAIEQFGFEQIFLATDSEETVEFISNKYPKKVVVYSDVARAPKGSKKLAIFDNSIKRDNNNYLLGYEVLRDMLTLAACQGLIASYSNISLAVEITKVSYDEVFEYKKIIKTQINTKGVSVNKAVKNMERNKN